MSTIKFLALYFWTKYREQRDACMKCVLYIALIFYKFLGSMSPLILVSCTWQSLSLVWKPICPTTNKYLHTPPSSNMTELQISWKWVFNVSIISPEEQHSPLSHIHCSMKIYPHAEKGIAIKHVCKFLSFQNLKLANAIHTFFLPGQPARWGRCAWNPGGNFELALLDQNPDNDKTN